jgi:MFS family permease
VEVVQAQPAQPEQQGLELAAAAALAVAVAVAVAVDTAQSGQEAEPEQQGLALAAAAALAVAVAVDTAQSGQEAEPEQQGLALAAAAALAVAVAVAVAVDTAQSGQETEPDPEPEQQGLALAAAAALAVAVAVDTAQSGQEAEPDPEPEQQGLALAAAAFAAAVAAAFAAFAFAAAAASIGVETSIVAAAALGPFLHRLAFYFENSKKTRMEARRLAYEAVREKAPQERSPYDAETLQHHCFSPYSIINSKQWYLLCFPLLTMAPLMWRPKGHCENPSVPSPPMAQVHGGSVSHAKVRVVTLRYMIRRTVTPFTKRKRSYLGSCLHLHMGTGSKPCHVYRFWESGEIVRRCKFHHPNEKSH